MKLHLFSLLPFAIAWFHPQMIAQIGFTRENITVAVGDNSCSLEADYYFRNPADRQAACAIFYPLLNREDLPYPDSILVLADSSGTRSGFEKTNEGIMFFLTVKPQETRRVRVWYHQRTPSQRFEYVLTSTKAWGKPLELAEFRIVVPDSLELTSCSPSFDTKEICRHDTVYHIKRHDFMPVSNLVVQWKRRLQ